MEVIKKNLFLILLFLIIPTIVTIRSNSFLDSTNNNNLVNQEGVATLNRKCILNQRCSTNNYGKYICVNIQKCCDIVWKCIFKYKLVNGKSAQTRECDWGESNCIYSRV